MELGKSLHKKGRVGIVRKSAHHDCTVFVHCTFSVHQGKLLDIIVLNLYGYLYNTKRVSIYKISKTAPAILIRFHHYL